MPIIPHPCNLQSLRDTAKGHLKDNWHSVQLDLQTITPVYGGGTVAGEPDLLLPFRPRAIKNGLRHWWWLLNRHTEEYRTDSEKLYKDMCDIWGGASDSDAEASRAKVRVRVKVDRIEDEKVLPYIPFRIKLDEHTQQYKLQTTIEAPHFYAMWMLKPKNSTSPEISQNLQAIKENRIQPGPLCSKSNKVFADKLANIPGLFTDKDMPVRKILLPGIDWSLTIEIDQKMSQEQKKQINHCLQAWLMLGGVGARTTRGLGRSKITKVKTDTKAFQTLTDIWNPDLQWFQATFGKRHALRDEYRDDPINAWEDSIRIYKNFRQARQKNANNQPMKQSYGHLANSLRKLTNKIGHPLPTVLATETFCYPLPEVMFGAPIVYQFISKNRSNPEPPEGEIVLSDSSSTYERYTSPLLVTCVRINDQQYAPVCLCFENHASDILNKDVTVKFKNGTHPIPPKQIKTPQWWPDLNTIEGKNLALDWLGEDYRNPPRTAEHYKNHLHPNSDPLYEELLDAAYRDDSSTDGDPLLVCLNFFRFHELNQQ